MIFNKKRIAFVVIGNNVILQQDMDDERTCHDWMREDLNLGSEAYQHITRGYMLPGRIQFFTGAETCCPDYRVTLEIIEDAITLYTNLYTEGGFMCVDPPTPSIYNGVFPGKAGDTWPPVLEWNGRWRFAR